MIIDTNNFSQDARNRTFRAYSDVFTALLSPKGGIVGVSSVFLPRNSIRTLGKIRRKNKEMDWRNALEFAVRSAIESGKNRRISVHNQRQGSVGTKIVLRRATNVVYRIRFVVLPRFPIGTLLSRKGL